ncbi:MAG: pantoate--beta-alanine ligase [Salinivirgaceae bacterium]|nr:pantoate--beta-alanine ligase [Salinivirgaceae bacterium]MDD4747322.1 pantoate--beta-alanine ligase [Salinivirgaceae bacterium]
MEIFNSRTELSTFVEHKRSIGCSIGFVPTMGALHSGHLKLVKETLTKCDIVVVSIFVNPTQFNNSDDLRLYPRNEKRDFELLRNEGCDAVFFPTVEEIYPQQDHRIFDLGGLDTVMEGQFRPGHFQGVVQVVTRLFDIVNPDVASFGKKDFQQLTIIKHITDKMGYSIRIDAVETIRESDGLAMSSRNERLTKEQRSIAPNIYRILNEAKAQKHQKSIQEVEDFVTQQIDALPYMKTEYFSIVNHKTLQPLTAWHEKCDAVGCIAVYCGDVRLIDNIYF